MNCDLNWSIRGLFLKLESCINSARRKEIGIPPCQGQGSDWTVLAQRPCLGSYFATFQIHHDFCLFISLLLHLFCYSTWTNIRSQLSLFLPDCIRSSLRRAGSFIEALVFLSCALAQLPHRMWDLISPAWDSTCIPSTLGRWATREIPKFLYLWVRKYWFLLFFHIHSIFHGSLARLCVIIELKTS